MGRSTQVGGWGSRAPEHRLGSGSAAREICLDQRSNRFLLHWQADSLPLSRPGSPNSHLSRSFFPEKTMTAKDEHLSPLPAGRVLLKYNKTPYILFIV